MSAPREGSERAPWRRAALDAALVCTFLLGLIIYWFAVADRFGIFLYGHMTQNIPTAGPFDANTRSRHWMVGLVATGAVLALYTGAYWVAGRIAQRRGRACIPPAWWRVWALCAGPLVVAIPAITMTVNAPTLPADLAAALVVATLAGLALALLPAAWAAKQPRTVAWLAADGLGLLWPLMAVRALELPARGLSVSPALARVYALGGVIASVVWLAVLALLRRWRRAPLPSPTVGRALAIFLAGLAWAYLAMPLAHHLLATPPGWRYITNASNFFAWDLRLQALAVGVAAALAWGAAALQRLVARP